MRYTCTSIVATLMLAGTSFAATINVPGDYALIQDAIIAASDGDTISIASGVYNEHDISNNGKSIIIEGALNDDGYPLTTIDANYQGRVFFCDGDSSINVTYKNMTIKRGSGNGDPDVSGGGGMIVIGECQPHIEKCIFLNNSTSYYGAGLLLKESGATLIDCIFEDNSVGQFGGGINKESSGLLALTRCSFIDNVCSSGYGAGGGVWLGGGNAYIEDCLFDSNQCNSTWSYSGGGLGGSLSNTTVIDSTFINNVARQGGGLFCDSGSPSIQNCTFTSNSATNSGSDGNGGGIWSNGNPTIANTQVCGNTPDQIHGNWTNAGGNTVETLCGKLGGACCIENDCLFLEQDACEASGGEWQGQEVQCNVVNCTPPPPYGACCINGAAISLYQSDCELVQGLFMGDGTSPDDVSCPPNCSGDVDGNGEVAVDDILILIGNWGPCP